MKHFLRINSGLLEDYSACARASHSLYSTVVVLFPFHAVDDGRNRSHGLIYFAVFVVLSVAIARACTVKLTRSHTYTLTDTQTCTHVHTFIDRHERTYTRMAISQEIFTSIKALFLCSHLPDFFSRCIFACCEN